jgi:hypothetical protein
MLILIDHKAHYQLSCRVRGFGQHGFARNKLVWLRKKENNNLLHVNQSLHVIEVISVYKKGFAFFFNFYQYLQSSHASTAF